MQIKALFWEGVHGLPLSAKPFHGMHTKGLNSLDGMISQVPSNSATFYCSKSSESLGRQSGFSVNMLSSGLLSDGSALHLCVSTSPHTEWHLLPLARKPLPPTAGASFGSWLWPVMRSSALTGLCAGQEPAVGHAQPLVPLCSRHSPQCLAWQFSQWPTNFSWLHLMFLGLVLFLSIMFHSGISQLCMRSKWCCKRMEEV